MPDDFDWDARIDAAARHPLTPPPDRRVRAARDLFRVHRRAQDADRPAFFARLFFDSRSATPGAPAFAREGGVPAASFLRRYRARERAVEIWQEPIPGGTTYLVCQVAGAAVVTLEAQGGGVRTGQSLGGDEWHFDAVPAGTHTVRVRTLDGDLLVPGLEVGESGA